MCKPIDGQSRSDAGYLQDGTDATHTKENIDIDTDDGKKRGNESKGTCIWSYPEHELPIGLT